MGRIRTVIPQMEKLARLKERRTLIHLAWVAAILAVALAARIFWVIYAPADPTDGRHMDDTQFYHFTAISLSKGEGYVHPFTGAPTAQWPPGYSFLLGGLYRLFGPDVAVAWGVNIVLGALTCVALYMLGCLMVSQRVGAIAGLLLAIFPGHVFFSSLLLSETLFTFLVVVAMTLIVVVGQRRDTGWQWVILVGVVVGASALVRGQGLLLIFVAGLFWWLYTADWEKALERAVLVGLTCVAVIVPWTIRNYVAMNGLVFISTNDGGNLYMGNHEFATGGFMLNAADWIVNQYSDLPFEEQEVASSNAAMSEGLRYMFTHPWRELQLAGSKLRFLYEHDKEGLEWIDRPEVGSPVEHRSMLEDIANGFYFGVLVISAGGLLYWLRRPRSAVALPLLVILLFTLGQLLFFTIPRFHFPMLPSFALLAAVGLVFGVEYVRSRRWLPGVA